MTGFVDCRGGNVRSSLFFGMLDRLLGADLERLDVCVPGCGSSSSGGASVKPLLGDPALELRRRCGARLGSELIGPVGTFCPSTSISPLRSCA